MRTEVFWDSTQRTVIIPYRRFGTTSKSHLQGSINPNLEDGIEILSRKIGKEPTDVENMVNF